MDPYLFPLYQTRARHPSHRFDLWTAEIATMNHAALNIAAAVDGLVLLTIAAVQGVVAVARRAVAAVRSLRQVHPVDIEPVLAVQPIAIARPVNDRAAA